MWGVRPNTILALFTERTPKTTPLLPQTPHDLGRVSQGRTLTVKLKYSVSKGYIKEVMKWSNLR